MLNIRKGEPYDVVTMQKRLLRRRKAGDQDVSKIYRDNGYLFFQSRLSN